MLQNWLPWIFCGLSEKTLSKFDSQQKLWQKWCDGNQQVKDIVSYLIGSRILVPSTLVPKT